MSAPSDRRRPAPQILSNRAGLRVACNANGSIRRIDLDDTLINLFPGNEVEGGPTNLYLRCHDAKPQFVPLLGPASPAAFSFDGRSLRAAGRWQGIHFAVALVLAGEEAAWFWHVDLENAGPTPRTVDLVLVQDIALAPYGAVRLNEYYVSHYVDHQPLDHAQRGWVVASRQNLASDGRNPWAIFGSLRRGVAFATDALDLYGPAARPGLPLAGLVDGLPGRRQHEHSMVAIQDPAIDLAPDARSTLGFFGAIKADHPAATSSDDLARVERILALPEANRPPTNTDGSGTAPARSLFAPAALLGCIDLDEADINALFGTARRNEEREAGELLSFFAGDHSHVVLRAKECRVVRPHGHILHTGAVLAPDETALASTTWMSGVFHSMVTQGHVGINRFLSTTRGYLGLFRSHGQRVFAEIDGAWRLLDLPSAFEIAPASCRWLYKHAQGLIEVCSSAVSEPHELRLSIAVRAGAPARFLICHHIALDGDDGADSGARWSADAHGVFITPPPGSGLAQRFPAGGFRIVARSGTCFARVGGDEMVFADGGSRGQPFVCIVTAAASTIGIGIRGELIAHSDDMPRGDAARTPPALPRIAAPAGAAGDEVARLAEILPWYRHNALIHFLAPRGLEQYSGGGWGTRDVCQGPVELLLVLDRSEPVREMLRRVFAAQNPDGDWPQWFTFFERERNIRAGDSHGDIVFWPLLALAQYLLASEDAALLDERVPFFAADATRAEQGTVWQHVERALGVIGARRVRATQLAAYGHGDWNDALQPVDPSMREHMCSAWTVTLHTQVLNTLAAALRRLGRDQQAAGFEAAAARVREDFQNLLLVDDVVTGYALFGVDGSVEHLLHPRDARTGVRYSLLPMIHAILSDMLSPAQARAHLALIAQHLTGPDGARLFDRPLAYRGGPQRLFQRAESSAFFGREIGLMYTHAHLRYAEALAHMGQAQAFFEALNKANPIGLRCRVAAATLRQANCYYSSSDAAFRDRYEASAWYDRTAKGEIPLDGGWRIYSSGPGIALSLIVRCLLGVRREKSWLTLDPVLPRVLDGLRVDFEIAQRPVTITYQVGAAGCGPIDVALNGAALPFTRGANPYRTGAAEIPMAEFAARLRASGNVLTVRLG